MSKTEEKRKGPPGISVEEMKKDDELQEQKRKEKEQALKAKQKKKK